MDQAEIKKVCRSCGEDVSHNKRHKHRDGTYSCPKCQELQKGSAQQTFEGLASKKFLLFFLYVMLAIAACWFFWKVLDYMNQPGVFEG